MRVNRRKKPGGLARRGRKRNDDASRRLEGEHEAVGLDALARLFSRWWCARHAGSAAIVSTLLLRPNVSALIRPPPGSRRSLRQAQRCRGVGGTEWWLNSGRKSEDRVACWSVRRHLPTARNIVNEDLRLSKSASVRPVPLETRVTGLRAARGTFRWWKTVPRKPHGRNNGNYC